MSLFTCRSRRGYPDVVGRRWRVVRGDQRGALCGGVAAAVETQDGTEHKMFVKGKAPRAVLDVVRETQDGANLGSNAILRYLGRKYGTQLLLGIYTYRMDMLTDHYSRMIYHNYVLSPGCLAQFPSLTAYHARVLARPHIQAYRKSEGFKTRPINFNGKHFKLGQDIIKKNLLTQFHDDRTI
ncbi:hypothetical protein DPMN_049578 [Dreissena polymorpha]|uniref:Glutathione S-transferase C-terminal domain-containing protein n=1 Tax=Dreissena polymorpha TaxID=45954 RepID=A0A9D4CEL4_DREPO|nr:hypothetical protein DPMN_049578 [Dreissena polymorpha]